MKGGKESFKVEKKNKTPKQILEHKGLCVAHRDP